MAKVKEGIRKLMESDLIPDKDYEGQVMRVRDAGTWEVADVSIVDAEPELIGRRLSYFLGEPSTNSWRGLTELLKAAKLEEVPKDENGDQDTKTSLVGVKFPMRVRRRDGKRGPENVVYPIADNDWVGKMMGGGPSGEAAPRRRKSSTGSPRRRRS